MHGSNELHCCAVSAGADAGNLLQSLPAAGRLTQAAQHSSSSSAVKAAAGKVAAGVQQHHGLKLPGVSSKAGAAGQSGSLGAKGIQAPKSMAGRKLAGEESAYDGPEHLTMIQVGTGWWQPAACCSIGKNRRHCGQDTVVVLHISMQSATAQYGMLVLRPELRLCCCYSAAGPRGRRDRGGRSALRLQWCRQARGPNLLQPSTAQPSQEQLRGVHRYSQGAGSI